VATGNPVVNAILAGTNNLRVREAMLIGSRLESGWNPTAVGDQGTSFGPFQMHQGGALGNLTPAQAENPPTAVSAMLAAYQSAVSQISDALWSSNPELAAEQAAVLAEKPAQSYYAAQGKGNVDAAWAATQQALMGIASAPGGPSTNATLTGLNPLSPSSWIQNIMQGLGIPTIGEMLKRFGLILLGGALVLIGVYMLVGKEATKIGLTVMAPEAEAGEMVAGGVASASKPKPTPPTKPGKRANPPKDELAERRARRASEAGVSETIESAAKA
jgi:hypothetical protein